MAKVCEGDRLYDNVVTFRRMDAVLQVADFDSRMAGDIRFQFKTSWPSGILLQKVGNLTGDLLEVKLVQPREIAFRYAAVAGVDVISIMTPFDLNDNEWHTVQIERNRKEARLNIDAISEGSPEDLHAYRPFIFTSNLTIGGSVNYQNGFLAACEACRLVRFVLSSLSLAIVPALS